MYKLPKMECFRNVLLVLQLLGDDAENVKPHLRLYWNMSLYGG